MAGILQRYDVIHEPNNMLSFDDGAYDHTVERDPDTGLLVQRPVKVTPEQAHEVEVQGWRKALESVEHRLTLDPSEHLAFQEPPSSEQVARKVAGLEAERQHCLDRLAELEATEPVETAKKGGRR